MSLTTAAIAGAVKAVCADEPVRLAYVFGSYAWGVPDKESDIDIAVLAEPALTKEERWKLHLRLMVAFAKTLGVSDELVDIVILQDAPPLLKYNAAFKGICILERDRSERNLFVLKVEQEYDDERYYLRRDAHMLIHQTLSPAQP